MFEPQDKQLQQQGQGGSPNVISPRPRPPQPRPPLPQNLPTGAQTQTRAPQSNRGEALPEDIFLQSDDIPVVEREYQEAIQREDTEIDSPPPQVPPQLMEKPHTKRKILVFVLSAFIVAFLLIAGYLIYRIVQARQNIPDEVIAPAPVAPITEKNTDSNVEPVNVQDKADISTVIQEDDQTTDTDVPPKVKEPEEEEPKPIAPKEEPPQQKDSDGDGLLDTEELQIGSNPNVIDTDFDGLDDYSEVRARGTNPIEKDTDGDGLTDGEEIKIGSDPKIVDTDQDGVNDYMEVKTYKSDPTKKDTDGDGFDDGMEIQNGYSPIGPGKL